MDAIITPPAAEIETPSATEIRTAAIKAWHTANTEAERKAAVAKFPVLKEIFTIANHLK